MRADIACRSLMIAAGLGWLPGCASGTPATPQQVALEEHRLLQPFTAGGEIGCQELLVEVSPNLAVHVSQPAIDVNLHHADKQQGDGYTETVWTNRIGDLTGAFVVEIGESTDYSATARSYVPGRGMKFTVTNQVRLRVHARGPMRLDATAKGDLVYMPTPAAAAQDMHEFRIEDGVLHRH